MLLMRPEREMSPSSEEFMLRVGSCTSAEERAGMSGKLGREKVSDESDTVTTTRSVKWNMNRSFLSGLM